MNVDLISKDCVFSERAETYENFLSPDCFPAALQRRGYELFRYFFSELPRISLVLQTN